MSNPVKNGSSKTLVMENFDPIRERVIGSNDRQKQVIRFVTEKSRINPAVRVVLHGVHA